MVEDFPFLDINDEKNPPGSFKSLKEFSLFEF